MQKKEELLTVNIGNINEGAAVDAFDLELRKVLENIADLSTVATATRSITLRVDFKPESDRCKVHTEFVVSTKLAGHREAQVADLRWAVHGRRVDRVRCGSAADAALGSAQAKHYAGGAVRCQGRQVGHA
jgi:hypothetical protein